MRLKKIFKKKNVIAIILALVCICCLNGQQRNNTYNRYDIVYMCEGDSVGKKFHIVGIPSDTALYYGTYGEEIIDINGDGLKDAIGRMRAKSLPLEYRELPQFKTDTINQLCIYINEGDSIFRYKTRSAFVLSDYYMPWYSILPYGNNGFCIRTEGRQLDWNKYYLYFQYDKPTDRFYLVRSLVQAEYEDNTKKKVEEKIYDENTRILFEKVNFDVYFEHILNAVPQREDWRNIIVEKSIIFNNNLRPTSQYFIKNDNVRIDNEKDDFYQVTFFSGKKVIKGWIKKNSVSD